MSLPSAPAAGRTTTRFLTGTTVLAFAAVVAALYGGHALDQTCYAHGAAYLANLSASQHGVVACVTAPALVLAAVAVLALVRDSRLPRAIVIAPGATAL